jgi:predicted nucleic acid-binding protein
VRAARWSPVTARAVVSDANILIDFEEGGLVEPIFQLGIVLAVPDVIWAEEPETRHARLRARGLSVLGLEAAAIDDTLSLARRYRRPSRNDLMALALARQEACSLLTGDTHLRNAAKAEGVEVHGTLWLARELLSARLVSPAAMRTAFTVMRDRGRRLPWPLVDELLVVHGTEPLPPA